MWRGSLKMKKVKLVSDMRDLRKKKSAAEVFNKINLGLKIR